RLDPTKMVIEHHYHDGEALVGAPFEAVMTNGEIRRGTLNGTGEAVIDGVPEGAIAEVRFGPMPGPYTPKDQRPMPEYKPTPSESAIDALLQKYSGGQA
ncbi:MAG: type VI secretion system tip protein VgrG, partial [Burkholderiales bacterium]|nr:type VI secretion system tip protein VgrG [Burkholderiales bacterium]